MKNLASQTNSPFFILFKSKKYITTIKSNFISRDLGFLNFKPS